MSKCESGFSNPDVEKSRKAFDSMRIEQAKIPDQTSIARRVATSHNVVSEQMNDNKKVATKTFRDKNENNETIMNQSGCVKTWTRSPRLKTGPSPWTKFNTARSVIAASSVIHAVLISSIKKIVPTKTTKDFLGRI
jgi:hypothetical protein